jgi:outer membrane protein assembly factor BamA
VNFLGGARTAGAHARWSSLDRGVRIDFTQPYLFRPHFSLGLEGQDWYTYTPAYNSIVTGGKATLTHRANQHTSWSVSMTSERDRSAIAPSVINDPKLRTSLIALGLDPTTLEQRGTLNAAGFDLQHSTADNVLNAHRGYQVAFHAEEAGTFLPGTYRYVAVSADARHYLPLSNRLVLATRLQLGNIAPPRCAAQAACSVELLEAVGGDDHTRVPFATKYFLGGATSIRGWGRYEVSPLSGSGLPIGGDSMLAMTAELRAALLGNLGGVLFADAGNVWAGSWGRREANDRSATVLRYAVGPGLRYQTPVGPIRFDFGYQLNPIDGLLVNGAPQKRRWRIHFSIGQAF